MSNEILSEMLLMARISRESGFHKIEINPGDLMDLILEVLKFRKREAEKRYWEAADFARMSGR